VQTQTPASGGGHAPTGSGGRPWGLAALIVAVGLLVFLGVTRWLLAQPAPTPAAPTPVPTVVPTVAPAVAPTTAPTTVPIAATEPARVPTATLQPVRTATPVPTIAPTPVPTLAEAWWERSSDQVDAQQAQVVLAALDRYWAVLIPAWRDLDTNHLDEVLTEPRLTQERQTFADQRAQGHAIDVKVDRGYHQVRDIRMDEAVVYEEYLNRSTEIDLNTKEPVEESTPKESAAAYLFRRSASGQWKVAEVATYDTPQAH
jgi:hypothetical protein